MAYTRKDDLCKPYATVIDIKADKLPTPESITKWTSDEFSNALRHIPGNPKYNSSFRQLIHVAFKVAAEYGVEYTNALKKNKAVVGGCVLENLYDRHMVRMFVLD
jgi:hypothetical protein